MKMMIEVNKTIFEKYPQLKLGIVVAKGLDNSGYDERIREEIAQAESQIRSKIELQSLVDLPKIADWRKAYTSFDSNPKTFKNSVESLMRRVLKGEGLPKINMIVDIYNLISIKHILPAGGDDIDRVEGNIHLTIAKGGEPFTLLGAKSTESAEPGEVIYRDDKEVLCRRWNWRECDKTKMTPSTKNVCLVIEALESTSQDELECALADLKAHLENYCHGTATTHTLKADNSTLSI